MVLSVFLHTIMLQATAKPWIIDMATEKAMHARNMNLTELQELNPEKARAVQKLIYEDKLRSIKHAADFEHQKNHAPQPRTGNEPVASAAKYFLRESKAYGAR